MSDASLPERIREWGGRELAIVSVCLAAGIVGGIVLSLLIATPEEPAANLRTSFHPSFNASVPTSCSDIHAESSSGTPEGGSSSDQVAPSDVPPSHPSPEEWRFVRKVWRSLFFHNLIAELLIATLGVRSRGAPAAAVLFNGGVVGFMGTAFVRHGGQSIVAVVLWVAPHGVIELTAVCVAGAAGMRLSRVAYEETWIDRLEVLGTSWPVLLVVVLLLALAAAIESVRIATDFGCF